MEIINYDTLLEKYVGIAFEKQYNLAEIIGESDWNIDLNTGNISFGSLSFPSQILGTYSFDSGTWLWAWANEASDIPSNLLSEAQALKKLGEENNIEFLSMAEYKMESTDVHSLGLIASGYFGSSAYYAGNFGSGILLITLKDDSIDSVSYNEHLRILSVFPEIVKNFTVNHKRSLINYLNTKGYKINENNKKLTAEKGENKLSADFDDLGRLISINGEVK